MVAIVHKGESGSFARDGSSPTITWEVAWSSRYSFIQQNLGGWRKLGGSFKFYVPSQHPALPGLFAESADLTDIGALDASGNPTTAHITVTYAKLDGNKTGLPIDASLSTEATVQFLSLPNDGGHYSWTGEEGGNGPDEGEKITSSDLPPQKLVSVINYTLTRTQPSFDEDTYLDLAGKVNSAAITVDTKSWGAQELLFTGFTKTESVTNDGYELPKVTYNLVGRPTGWNKHFYPPANGYFAITPAIYEEADLSPIFTEASS